MNYTKTDRRDLMAAGSFLRDLSARMVEENSPDPEKQRNQREVLSMALACGKALMLLDKADR